MSLALSPATVARVLQQVATGRYSNADDLIAHALDLLETEAAGDWLFQNRDDIRRRLDESIAARDRGESYSPDEAKAILAERRATRARQAA